MDDYSHDLDFWPVVAKDCFLTQALQPMVSQVLLRAQNRHPVFVALHSDWASEIARGQSEAWCHRQGIHLHNSSPGKHASCIEPAINTLGRVARAMQI